MVLPKEISREKKKFRKATHSKAVFTNDKALLKMLSLVKNDLSDR